MNSVRAIAHRLTRQTGDQSFHLKEQPIGSEVNARKLLNEIEQVFTRRATKRYGRFADEATSFKGVLLNWQEKGMDLTQFSSKVVELLAVMFESEDLETDGYWVFIEQDESDLHELWIAQLKQAEGWCFDQSNELIESEQIEFSKMGLCCCIDLKRLFDPSASRYLTLGFGFGDRSATRALGEFIGFFDTVDTQADTERFMEVVRDYSAHMPEDTGKRYQKEVAEFCIEQSKAGESVSYRDLTASVETDHEVGFDQYIASEAPELKEQFIPDRASLKKYVRYTGRTREVSISFSNESLGKSISFDPSSETLTLKDLPTNLIKQLKEQLEPEIKE